MTDKVDKDVLGEILQGIGLEAQPPPKWSKVPDCPCYSMQSVQRGIIVDEAVFKTRELIANAYEASGVCTDAAFAFLGCLIASSVGLVYVMSFRDPKRDGPLLSEEELAEVLRLLDDAHQNAKDRTLELNKYLAAKHAN